LSGDELVELSGLASSMGAVHEWEALHRVGPR
jgi:hypothetical protein